MADAELASIREAETPPAKDAAPDWATHTAQVLCPLCNYNLRGLTDPRCPECGYSFRWSEVLDSVNRVHPYLFEHHRNRNFWSFRKTVFNGWLAGRFWKTITPLHEIVPGRLVLYWLVSSLVGAVLFVIASYWPLVGINASAGQMGAFSTPNVSATDLVVNYWKRDLAPYALSLTALLILWPWLTFLTLMVFQISMRRAGIRKLHVLRTVLYSGDFILWGGVCAVLIAGMLLLIRPQVYLLSALDPWFTAVMIGCWLMMAYRLQVAYRRYLKFDHPLATVLASQLIAVLAVPATIVVARLILSAFEVNE